MVDATLALPPETRLMVLAPVVRDRKGEFQELFADMQSQGYVRFRVDQTAYESSELPRLKKAEKHDIDVVIDRVKVQAGLHQRLAESFEAALRIADGRAVVLEMDSGREHLYSSKFACPVCSYSLSELEPRLFSFNSPVGACPSCDGLGQTTVFDPERVVAFPSLSLASGAVKGWDRRNAYTFALLQSVARHYRFDLDTAFEELPESVRHVLLYGSGTEPIEFVYEAQGARGKPRSLKRAHPFEGILPNLERRLRETDSTAVREDLMRYQSAKPCPECEGTRLRREARNVFLADARSDTREPIFRVEHFTLRECLHYFETLTLQGAKAGIADKVVREIRSRLKFLNDVGLNYLSLDRNADSLSGGESQRIRLASQIGSGLTGVMYVLDEPSIGLHQRDNARLIDTLRHLRDLGNSVLVVEHDEDAILAADHVIDMGPGAGAHGGRHGAGHGAGSGGQPAVPHRALPVARSAHRGAAAAPQRGPAGPGPAAVHPRRARQQPQERQRRHPGGAPHLRDRRVGVGQEHAGQRHAVRHRGPAPVQQPRRAERGGRDRRPGGA